MRWFIVTWRRIGTISFSSAVIRSRWRHYSGSTACIWILMCCSNWKIWFASMASRIKEALPWATSRIQFLCTWKLRWCEWIGWSSSNQAFLIFSVLHGWWILFRCWIDDIRSCFFSTYRSSGGRFYLSKAWNWKEVLINLRHVQNRQSNWKLVISIYTKRYDNIPYNFEYIFTFMVFFSITMKMTYHCRKLQCFSPLIFFFIRSQRKGN